MSDFFKGLWPRGLSAWFALFLGALSVLALIQHGFDYGFGPTFVLLLSYYDAVVHAVIGWWAEPIIKGWLAGLSAVLGWTLDLQPHWKHTSVLLGVLLIRFALPKTLDFEEILGDGLGGLFRVALGLGVTIIAGIGAGTVPPSQDLWSSFLIAGIPATGIALYLAGILLPGSWGDEDSRGSRIKVAVSIVGLVLAAALATIWATLHVPYIYRLSSPGLASLGALIIISALVMLCLGVYQTYLVRRNNEDSRHAPWLSVYLNVPSTAIGLSILGVFFWASAFIIANAGLRFYGL